jgi:DMSO reductase family type II enzyme heme b subunit
VFRRALRVSSSADEVIQMAAGETAKVAFAVWEGASGERAGLKAYSPVWHELALEA